METCWKSRTGCGEASWHAGVLGMLWAPEQEELKLGFGDLGQMQMHGEGGRIQMGDFLHKTVSELEFLWLS